MLAIVQTMVDQLIEIVDFGHSGDGKLAQMRIDDDGLRVGVADDADADVADELPQLIGELRAEIGVFDIVDRAVEQAFVVSDHACALCAEM